MPPPALGALFDAARLRAGDRRGRGLVMAGAAVAVLGLRAARSIAS